MRTLIFFNTLFGFFTIVAIGVSVVLIYLILSRKKMFGGDQYSSYLLFLPASIALFSTTGSLVYSEIIGFIPCDYCWYQRYIMYPLSIFLIYVVISKKYISLAAFFSAAGSLISIRHIYLQNVGGAGGSCEVDVPCTLKYVEIFNFISIPVMALTAFATIFLSLMYYELSNKVENE